MNHDEFNQLQQAQLEIMDEIHRICTKNGIDYYIVGGTGIGAMRHKGFIPWDVDIDISMYRDDYEKFKRVCLEDLNVRFEYKDWTTVQDYNRAHSVVCIKNTSLPTFFDKYNSDAFNVGIFVDVMPLDNVSNDEKLCKTQEEELQKLLKLKQYKLGFKYSSNLLKCCLKNVIKAALYPLPLKYINKRIEGVMLRYNSQETKMVCNMAGKYAFSVESVPREYFGEPRLVEFEGRKYYAPARINDYLTQIYGDYMKLPPEHERKENLLYFEKVIFDN